MMLSNNIQLPLPWQQQQWQRLSHLTQEQRLPHALLLTSADFTELSWLSEHWIAHLFCHQSLDQPCGHCHDCQLMRQQTHPDAYQIAPQSNQQAIKIDQIRHAHEFLNQTAQAQHRRVLLISQADKMTQAATNALLKILEEPPSKQALIILTTTQLSQILATVRSRCQLMIFPGPSEQQALQWLQRHCPQAQSQELSALLWMNAQQPLSILLSYQTEHQVIITLGDLEMLTQFVQQQLSMHSLVTAWQQKQPLFLVDLFIQWVVTYLYHKFQLAPNTISARLPDSKLLNELQLYDLLDELYSVKQNLYDGIALNQPLYFESLLSQLLQTVHGK